MFFERPEGGEKAILVHIDFHALPDQENLDEFIELAKSAGVQISSIVRAKRSKPCARTYIGKGKLEEISALVKADCADVVLFNHALKPSQERNLEKEFQCRVLDRTGVILDIFAQRAITHEGKMQVELAQLQHMSTRLIRGWTHLERQKGGIGLRGPGETQLETDRRLLRERIGFIENRLEKVQMQREQGRRGRSRASLPTVSIVGYTNAGKSTLFNSITGADVFVADQLFATLDPTLRRIDLPNIGGVILADTVGFIRHLPHKLVKAFKSTLEETVMADLLLHIVDAAAEDRDGNIEQVNAVLAEIGADKQPQILVYNKIDLLGNVTPHIDFDADGKPTQVWISAQKNLGLEELYLAIGKALDTGHWKGTLCIEPRDGQLRAQLFELDVINSEAYDENGNAILVVKIPLVEINRLSKKLSIDWQDFVVS